MLRRRADVAVYSPDGRLQLEVEVKSRRGATSDWAARLLRNMLFHEAAPAAPYFMLALPDKLYLWNLRQRPLTERMLPPEGAPAPDHEAEAPPVLAPYLGPYPNGGDAPTADLGEDGLTFVVAAWLTQRTFSSYAIDPECVAVGGYSDSASYALSLGITNGDLFSHVLAFSPGFVAPVGRVGSPRFFVSHGTRDGWLPIDRTSRRLVPELERMGYGVLYREFDGPHVVPPAIAREGVDWLTTR